MPELQFKGKEFVYNHHLTVPFRPLEMQADKGIGTPRLDGNLIVHGDNLHALKALLPMYAGKVDCIYIDPPYNTGSEGWCYNDNVNSPMIREWLSDNPIGLEDGLRHDKWACMMWPRLKLLHELLSENGVFFASCDENEISTLTPILDEIFGRENRVETVIWKKSYGGGAKERYYVTLHEYVLFYAKRKANLPYLDLPISEEKIARYYTKTDEYFEERGPYRLKPLEATKSMDARENLRYPILAPDGSEILPKRQWWWAERRFLETKAMGGIEFLKTSAGWSVQYKQYLNLSDGARRGEKPFSIMEFQSVQEGPYTQTGTAELREIFDGESAIPYPKPTKLIETLLASVAQEWHDEFVVLDSFAGSGSTGHAVLAASDALPGKRKFILIEQESYADGLTAERIRRVIEGVPTAKSAKLREGLGGEFTFCTLGDPVEMDAVLSGESLPTLEAIAGLLWHTATATPQEPGSIAPAANAGVDGADGLHRLGEHGGRTYWLAYKPDLDWLKSGAAALSLTMARAIAASAPGNHLVFAPAKFVSRELLAREKLDVDYAPLPFALYRLETA